jgi:hypothetical protein
VIAAVLVEDEGGGSAWLEHAVAMPELPASGLLGFAVTAGAAPGAPTITAAQATFCEIELRRAGIASFLRGDCNGDGSLDIADAICTLEWLFLGKANPGCHAATDTNADGAVDITDPIAVLGYLFLGGRRPAAPYPGCGLGEAEADAVLGCAVTAGC